jgi:hypothetical protein
MSRRVGGERDIQSVPMGMRIRVKCPTCEVAEEEDVGVGMMGTGTHWSYASTADDSSASS